MRMSLPGSPDYATWSAYASVAWCAVTMHDCGLAKLADCDGSERLARAFTMISMVRTPCLIGDLHSIHPLIVMVPRP